MLKLILFVFLLTSVSLFAATPQASASPLPNMPTAEAINEVAASKTASFSAPAAWKELTFWIIQKQRAYHRSLSAKVEALSEAHTWRSTWYNAWLLLLLSFLYGVFHAAGPGHGKAVLTTYLLTQPEKLRQGLQLSVMAALLQGVTAILLVSVLVHGLGWLAKEAFASVIYVEAASFILVALLGLLLMIRGVRQLLQAQKNTPPKVLATIPRFSPINTSFKTPLALQVSAKALSSSACSSCGKVHHVTPEQFSGRNRLQNLGLVVSIGLRPCSGAVLVLVATNLLGLWWIGVLAILAMSLGTALTVASLATLAVQARLIAKRLLKLQNNGFSQLGALFALAGGGFILLLGISLFLSSLSSNDSLMLF